MNPFGITPKSYQLLVEAFLKYPEVKEIVIFGSRAKGNYKPGSDIDLAIKGENCTIKTAWNINAYLNEVLPIPYYVDVIYYDGLESAQLKDHIDRVGKQLLHSN